MVVIRDGDRAPRPKQNMTHVHDAVVNKAHGMTTQKSGGAPGVEQPAKPVSEAGRSAVDSVLQGTLGKRLRDSYQEVVNEEVPAKFLILLEELKKKESGSGEEQS